jgi:NAD(P)-dependent dehydrogenase (short-subunit alcohol dehydrogenase family)
MKHEVGDMNGKTVVITGGNSGIGKATAVALARTGAHVVITARDAARGDAAVTDIKTASGRQDVDLVLFDLASLASVRKGAAEILDRFGAIDVLVNNAGIVLSERRLSEDGFEATFATNHLGPFLLTGLLLDSIKSKAPARIVNVASTAHKGARRGLNFDDLQFLTNYNAMGVYSASKLENIYFTIELARRLAGSGVTANSLHPGTVATGYGRDGDTKGVLGFGIKLASPFFLSAEKGARTSIYLASSPEVASVSGQYFVKCEARTPSKAAQNAEAARRLWDVSEQLIAET